MSALARRMNATRGRTYQQLQTLVAAGWVEPVGEGRYRLTLRAMVVGNAVLEQADLGSRVLPTLASLAGQTERPRRSQSSTGTLRSSCNGSLPTGH